MRHHCIRLLFLFQLVVIGLLPPAFGQQKASFDPITDDISSRIPPLETLIDSAIRNNPSIHFRDLQAIVNACKLKAAKIDWTRNIGVQADLRYGNFYNYSTNWTSGGIEPPDVATNLASTKYGGALYVSLPLYTLFNRRNNITLAESELEQATSMAAAQRLELRQTIIRQYNDVILKQNLLRIKSKFLETSRITTQMAEKEFLNGVIQLSEYSRSAEISARVESDFETIRMDFVTAYMVLEELVGFKFNLIK